RLTARGAVRGHAVLLGGARRDQAVTEDSGLDQRHLVWLDESRPLKVRRHPIAGILTQCDRGMQAGALCDHLEQGGLFGAVVFEAETAPGERVQDVLKGRWRQVDAIAPRGDGMRRAL